MRHPSSFFNETLTHLRRNFRPKRRVGGVMLDLLYFMALDVVVILFMWQKTQDATQRVPALSIELPVAAAVEGVVLNSKVLTVSQEGLLFFDNERVSLADIDKRFREMVDTDPDLTLIIAADKRVDNGDLAGIYNKALQANIKRVSIAVRASKSEIEPQSAP